MRNSAPARTGRIVSEVCGVGVCRQPSARWQNRRTAPSAARSHRCARWALKDAVCCPDPYLLDRLPHIDTLICLGAAGALAAHLAVGDVVVASETVEHDFTQRFRRHPLPRFPADASRLASVQQLPLQALRFRVHVGIVASGDEDVIELERAATL